MKPERPGFAADPGLADFQARFREYIRTGRHEDVLAAQTRPGGVSATERLGVYRRAYYIRLETALAHDFPVLERVLGKEAFARAAAEYLLAHPSRSPSLRQLGSRFPGWLAASGLAKMGLAAEKLPARRALADLAAIEWAALAVFDGPDAEVLSGQALDAVGPERWPDLQIRLAPTLSLQALRSNADRVWLGKDSALRNEETERCVALWRGGSFRPQLAAIDAATFAVLSALQQEPALSRAAEALTAGGKGEHLPEQIASALCTALARGWVAGLDSID